MEIVLGMGLLAFTYFGFKALKPVGTTVHPLMRQEVLGTCIVLGLVASLAIGSAFMVDGIVKFL